MATHSKLALEFFNKATDLHQSGEMKEAEQYYRRALVHDDNFIEAYSNFGVALQFLKKYDEAIALFHAAITIDANYVDAHYNLGVIYYECEKNDEAIQSYTKVIQIDPTYQDAYSNRGVIYHNTLRYDEALLDFNIALTLNPNFSNAYFNRGNVYFDMEMWEDALHDYSKAEELKPTLAIYNNKANTLRELRRYDEAFQYYNYATDIDDDFSEAHWNKAYVKLIQGDYKSGFEYYEYRWKYNELQNYIRPYPELKWLGEQPLTGKIISVHPEQGNGDVIQALRYIPMLEQLGAKVVLEVYPALIPLVKSSENVTVLPIGSPVAGFNYHIPIMSLPYAFGTKLGTIPVAQYIFADEEKSKYWKNRLGPKTKRRIGIVWAGGDRSGMKRHHRTMESKRNIKLKMFAGLRDIDAEFYSLQKGSQVQELIELKQQNWDGPNIIDYTEEFNDFGDTAAFIDNLDLVIAVDTAVVHIAGAMGKPTWMLNRYDGCWRWLQDRADSPWYPSITLFNQLEPNNWEHEVSEIIHKLKQG